MQTLETIYKCIYMNSVCAVTVRNFIIHSCLFNRRVHTESAMIWLELLQEKSVPTLVCLTFADKLYAGYMHKDGTHPQDEHVKEKIERELMVNPTAFIPKMKILYYEYKSVVHV